MTDPPADPTADLRPLSQRAAPAPVAAPADAAWLEGLNDRQREAVEQTEGPVLVLAGAGTGKTRALTARIAHILATRRALPWQILAVTFTNRAAGEMRERVGRLVAPLLGPGAAAEIWLGTFHGLALRILRRHPEPVGLKPGFTILDTDDQLRLLGQQFAAAGIDQKRWPPRVLHATIERWKDRGRGPEQVTAAEAGDFADGRAVELYAAYRDRLRSLNAVDFGDLLLHNLTLLMQHEDIQARYSRRFRYILVDEYQDANVAQYLWLRLLAQQGGNLCCVGDDDQSIYRWRGAEIENILRFEKDFPGAKVIRLEQNYRSTAPILAAASRLISRNASRLGKTLWTAAAGGDKLTLTGVWDGDEEARSVADRIEDLQRKAHPLNEIAILVRAGFQTREFEERFLTLNIPYRVIGGPRFYERLEIRDAIAWLRLVRSTADDLAFERIVNRPRRGVGDATLRLLHRLRTARGLSLFDAARAAASETELRPAARRSLAGFVQTVERWRGLAATASHVDLAEIVLDESGYTAMWQNDKSPAAPGRLESLKELVGALAEFDDLGGFLEHIALVMETAGSAQGDMVSLMTLHSAKGLEFDTVFLPGWEEGVFPHQRALDEGEAGLEEERRLAYVGLTRARRNVHLSFAANRRIHSQWASRLPSRFIDELPVDRVEVATPPGLYAGRGGPAASGGFGAGGGSGGRGGFDDGWHSAAPPAGGPARIAPARIAPPAPARTASAGTAPTGTDGNLIRSGGASAFRQGDPVRHEKFGKGVVRRAEGDKLTVIFENGGEKKIVSRFVVPA